MLRSTALFLCPDKIAPNFSRDVQISIAPVQKRPANDGSEPPPPVTGWGNILRVHSMQDGHRIDEERLTVSAPKWTSPFGKVDDHD